GPHPSPAAIPRSGARQRNSPDQPRATSQSRTAIADALLFEECEMKMRDTGHSLRWICANGQSIGRASLCHRIEWCEPGTHGPGGNVALGERLTGYDPESPSARMYVFSSASASS